MKLEYYEGLEDEIERQALNRVLMICDCIISWGTTGGAKALHPESYTALLEISKKDVIKDMEEGNEN